MSNDNVIKFMQINEKAKKAIEFVLQNEGGYTEDKDDPGGCTNFGISLRFMQSLESPATKEFIKNLTKPAVIEIYKIHFWDKWELNQIEDINIAIYFLDMIVNHGIGTATEILQTAICTTLQDLSQIEIDRCLGSKTIKAINSLSRILHMRTALISSLVSLRYSYYHAICIKNPELKKFLKGWIKRAFTWHND